VSEIEITQEDREAAEARWGIPLNDTDPDVQMLARHRQAARERALDEALIVIRDCMVGNPQVDEVLAAVRSLRCAQPVTINGLSADRFPASPEAPPRKLKEG